MGTKEDDFYEGFYTPKWFNPELRMGSVKYTDEEITDIEANALHVIENISGRYRAPERRAAEIIISLCYEIQIHRSMRNR